MQYRLLVVMGLSTGLAGDLRGQVRAPESCTQYEAVVRANPDDVAAAVNLGRCSVRDYEMIAPDGDSTRLQFRSNWSTAVRALRHAVQLDPANGRAYRPLFFMLFAETRDGCSHVTALCLHVSPVLRDADSLITVPRPVPERGTGFTSYDGVVQETLARQRPSLVEARELADRWASVAPNDYRPHEYRGRALLRLGEFAAAADALERAATMGTPASRRELFWERFEALVKATRGVDARRMLDEAAADPGRDTTQLSLYTRAGLNALVGRYRPPPVDTARMLRNRARFDSVLRNRPPPPPREPTVEERLAAGDTAGARRAVARTDSMMTPRPGEWRSNQYTGYFSVAQQYLAIGDTVRAEARLADVERPFQDRQFRYRISRAYGSWPWIGRAWLLSGDVAAARGRPDDALRMYRRLIGLWGGGDPDLQPVVNQARIKLDSLTRR